MAKLQALNAVIAAGDALSNSVECVLPIVSIFMPDDWLSAPITFQVSIDDQEYFDLCWPDGREHVVEVTPSGAVNVGEDFASTLQFVRIRSGTRDDPVVQPTARHFQIIVREQGSPINEPLPAVQSSGAKAPAARRKTPRKTALPRRKHR